MISIREATNNDINAIQAIYAYHVLNGLGTFEEIPPLKDEMLNRMQSIKDANYPYLVAEQGGEIVGFCYAACYRVRSAYRFTVEDSVYIAQGFQGRRIGYLLLEALIAKCRELKFKHILAFIGDTDNFGSVKLHQSLGFGHTGVLNKVGFKFGRWVDVVIMQLELA